MTPETLRGAIGCSAALAERYSEPLSAACAFYGIDTPQRLAAFIAQIGHESGSLRYVSELWGPTPVQIRYEGRTDLGNTQPGDGERFKGHGLIQTTGRYNHARVRDRLQSRFSNVPDFEADPEALTDPQWAAFSAADYWDDHKLNALADADEFIKIGRAINRGNPEAKLPANGEADRLSRWARAKTVLATPVTLTEEIPHPINEVAEKENTMPLPIIPILAAVLPTLIESIPKLSKLFGSGSEIQQRNVAGAELAVKIVQEAVGAKNAQEAAEIISSDPAAAQIARAAVDAAWGSLDEAGGGGIEGARKADAAAMTGDGPWWAVFRSPSFWAMLLMLPLVYLVVLSVIGVVGSAEWSADVRAAIAGTIVGSITGGLIGYYFGQTTSRNRTPA